MLKKQIQHTAISGYLLFDSKLTVSEIGGQSRLLFGISSRQKKVDFKNCISVFDKELQDYLIDCLNRARKSLQVANCSLYYLGKSYLITMTPLTNSDLILSFSQQEDKNIQSKDHQYWHSIHSKVITLTFNPKHQLVHTSGPLLNLFTAEEEHLLGKRNAELEYLHGLNAGIENLLTQVFGQEKIASQPFNLSVVEKNLFLKIYVYPELDAEGAVSFVHLSIVDYGDLDKKQHELLPVNEQYKMALDASQLGIWEWSVTDDTIFFSRKWKWQLGYYPDELDDHFSTFEKLIHQVDKDRVLREIRNFIKGDSVLFESEFRLRHKTGNYLWISCRASCIRDDNNNAVRLVGVNRDISEEKKTRDGLAIFKQALVQSPVPVIITDVDGYIEFFNVAFYKKSGWTPEEIIGKKPSILKSGFHSSEFYTKLWRTITNGSVWQGELKNKRKNGRYYTEFATISPLRNERGTITHFVKVSEDISTLKKLETDLRQAKRSAEVANIYKNNFLANMSHKIRTPLNGIIGFSDLLKSEKVSEEQQIRYIDIIQQNSAALLHLIDNIIDVARIEANDMKIKKESCSLNDTFIELKAQMLLIASGKGKESISLSFIVPREEHHDIIFTDPIRLKQILLILFENALKQTENGFIEIGYQVYSERKLQFYVHDTGTGINETQLDILNQQFGNSEKNISQNAKGGIGLGLNICRGLVRLLGGQMGVKSRKGKGSIFYFTIPYDKIKVQTPKSIIEQSKSSKYDFSKYTILIAEDVTYNFEYLKNIFASTGAKLFWAKDGIDVLNIFNNNKVDLILMDIQLPEISGFEATRQIRQKNKEIPIVAQTGYTMNEDREKCLAIGCNDVLVKPLKIEDVLQTVSKYLKG